MLKQRGKETVACMKCGYEFLYENDDPCPKCGEKLKKHSIEFPTASIRLDASLSTEQSHTEETRIVNKPLKVILIIILIISPITGAIITGWIGLAIGFCLGVISYILGNYAENRFIKRTIERDHSH